MKLIVTGGSGYIGSKFIEKYKDKYDIINMDLKSGYDLTKDCLSFQNRVDGVIHLAGFALDKFPSETTLYNNCKASENVALYCREHGIERIIFASSASIYGSYDSEVTELVHPKPQTAYADSKVISEGIFSSLCPNSLNLRQGTVSGISPNMRWDLIINSMVKSAINDGKVVVNGTGEMFRPILKIDDLISFYDAYMEGLDIYGTFNILSENIKVIDVAKYIAEKFVVPIVFNDKINDKRNYKMGRSLLDLFWKHEYGTVSGIVEEVSSNA